MAATFEAQLIQEVRVPVTTSPTTSPTIPRAERGARRDASAAETRVVLDLTIVEPYAEPVEGAERTREVDFLGQARVLVEQSGGECGPVRPGSATFTFGVTEASGALNAAIRIQEAASGEPGERVRCAIGLATGPTERVEADPVSVLGESVADAHHLAEAANVGAVLADIDTIAAVNLFEVRSSTGEQRRRSHREYVTPVGYLPVAGLAEPIAFVEVIWDEDSRGIRTTALREVAWWQLGRHAGDGILIHDADDADEPLPPVVPEWVAGRVRSWNASRQIGVVVADHDEAFYVDDRFIVGGATPVVASSVWFVPKPALIEGKNRVASTVLAADLALADQLVLSRGTHRYTEVHDPAGNRAELRCPSATTPGEVIAGRVVASPDGAPLLHH